MPNGEMELVVLETARPRPEELLIGAKARRLHGCSFSSQQILRRADFYAFAFTLCAQFARKFDRARRIAVDTDCFAAHIDVLAFD